VVYFDNTRFKDNISIALITSMTIKF